MMMQSIFDRYMFTTDTNAYAIGLNDENEWDENIMDYGISLEQREDDYFDDPDAELYLYNETGYDRERVN
jgi:hypothetical protein